MKIVALTSGGMDSAVLAWDLRARGHEVQLLAVDYGQRHRRELEAAEALAARGGFLLERAELSGLARLMGGSSQTDLAIPVPKGHYADETMRATVVPNRNMLLIALATALAVSRKAEAVAYAAHAGDHAIYPDCRPEFTAALRPVLELCDYSPIQLLVPFQHKTKGEIAGLGARHGVPFELTWTCYEGREKHCGECGACVERHEAFEIAGVSDPTEYA